MVRAPAILLATLCAMPVQRGCKAPPREDVVLAKAMIEGDRMTIDVLAHVVFRDPNMSQVAFQFWDALRRRALDERIDRLLQKKRPQRVPPFWDTGPLNVPRWPDERPTPGL